MLKNKKELSINDSDVLYLVLVVSFLNFILVLVNVVEARSLINFDRNINMIATIFNDNITVSISKLITSIFDPAVFIIILILVVAYLFYKRRDVEAKYLIIMIVIAEVIVNMFKMLVERARPRNILVSESTYSFPSSHAFTAVIFFGILVFLFEHHIKSRKLKFFLIGLATILTILVSITRIILHAHWFSDVLAGLSLGIFLLTAYMLAIIKNDLIIFKR